MDPDDLSVTFAVGAAALLGAVLGSFLNVCIARWPSEQSVIRPRSRCPKCQAPIAGYDNIPILSWLFLRGRCRHCREKISVQYPLVELVTAAIWGFTVYRHGVTPETLKWAIFGTILLGIAMTDVREYIIPDEFSLGGLVIGLGMSLLDGWSGLGNALLGAAVGFGVLWTVGYFGTKAFKEEAMGGGDIKMMAMVGAFLGWQGVLLTIFLGALLGSLIFVPLSLLGRRKLVPFGVFLSLGAAVTYLIGAELIRWYSGYLGG